MVTYKVTSELKTPWWLKLLRFFRIKSKREEFYLYLDYKPFKKGEILRAGITKTDLKIVEYGNK